MNPIFIILISLIALSYSLRRKMLTTYDLVNLDLGENPALTEFEIGPYTIRLKPDYSTLWKQMSHTAVQVEQYEVRNGTLQKTIQKKKAHSGKHIVTATATCKNEPSANLDSKFFQRNDNERSIWDLCLILSYLTGRRVFLKGEEGRYTANKFGQPTVNHEIFQTPLLSHGTISTTSPQKRRYDLFGII